MMWEIAGGIVLGYIAILCLPWLIIGLVEWWRVILAALIVIVAGTAALIFPDGFKSFLLATLTLWIVGAFLMGCLTMANVVIAKLWSRIKLRRRS